jgi:hypothetical protein
MRPINSNLKFVELEGLVFEEMNRGILARVNVKYLYNLSKVTDYFQYNLKLQKTGNWIITDSK